MVTYVSDKPFVRYDGAFFQGGVFSTDDEDKIQRLEKSKFYGVAFHRLTDIVTKQELLKMQMSAEDADFSEYLEGEEAKVVDSRKLKYDSMRWQDLRKYAHQRGVNIMGQTKAAIIDKLLQLGD